MEKGIKKLICWGLGVVALGGLIHLHEWRSAQLDAATGVKINKARYGDSLQEKVAVEVGKQMDSDGSFTGINVDSGAIDGTTIGASSASTGAFTTLSASSTLGVTGAATFGTATFSGVISSGTDTIAVDDTTPDVANGNIFYTGSNTVATAITDLDNPTIGQIVRIVVQGGANHSTIADSGNFNLAGAWNPDSADDNITLLIQADNDYIELGRVDN